MAPRKSIYIDAFSHKNPIPAAALVNGTLMSGIIYGLDPETGRAAEGMDAQCRLMFGHLKAILEAAGTTPASIVKLNVYLKDRSQREALNREWLELFPDPDDRPVRQAMQADLDGGKLIQCDFVAQVSS